MWLLNTYIGLAMAATLTSASAAAAHHRVRAIGCSSSFPFKLEGLDSSGAPVGNGYAAINGSLVGLTAANPASGTAFSLSPSLSGASNLEANHGLAYINDGQSGFYFTGPSKPPPFGGSLITCHFGLSSFGNTNALLCTDASNALWGWQACQGTVSTTYVGLRQGCTAVDLVSVC